MLLDIVILTNIYRLFYVCSLNYMYAFFKINEMLLVVGGGGAI